MSNRNTKEEGQYLHRICFWCNICVFWLFLFFSLVLIDDFRFSPYLLVSASFSRGCLVRRRPPPTLIPPPPLLHLLPLLVSLLHFLPLLQLLVLAILLPTIHT